MKPSIGMSSKHLDKSIVLLTAILSDEMILYIKTRKFHWNVTGESFMELHKLFEVQYTELEKSIDIVAERINQLGGKTIGTMKEFLQHTQLKEMPNSYPTQKEMLKLLLTDHEAIATLLHKQVEEITDEKKDIGTADLFTKLTQEHEANAWILRRYLQ